MAAGAKAKNASLWKDTTKASNFREIRRVKDLLNIDWFKRYKEETGCEVNEADVSDKVNDGILTWIFDDETRRNEFKKSSKNRPSKSKSKKENETSSEDAETKFADLKKYISKQKTVNALDKIINLVNERKIEIEKEQNEIKNMNSEKLFDLFNDLSEEEKKKILKKLIK